MGLLDSLKGLFGKGKSTVDVNNDGQVNAADASAVANNVQSAASSTASTVGQAADVNNDGQVNLSDAGAAVSGAQQAVTGAADVNNDGQVNAADANAAAQNIKNQLPQ